MITPQRRTAENVYTWIMVIAVFLLLLAIPKMVELAFRKESKDIQVFNKVILPQPVVQDTIYPSWSWPGSDTPAVFYIITSRPKQPKPIEKLQIKYKLIGFKKI